MNKRYDETCITAIAEAIRDKGVKGSFKISEMADAVKSIGGEPVIDKFTLNGACTYPFEFKKNPMRLNNGYYEIVTESITFNRDMELKVDIRYGEVGGTSSGTSTVNVVHKNGDDEHIIDSVSISKGQTFSETYYISIVAGDEFYVYKTNSSGWGSVKEITITEL